MNYMVLWTEGHWANVSSDGKVLEASSEPARADLEARLAGPVPLWVAAGDFMQTLQPGSEGHVEAALNQLPGAVVTTDA